MLTDLPVMKLGANHSPSAGRARRTRDHGFTLVEILIVVVILGILATVTVFAVRGATDSAEESTCSYERRVVLTAVESYFAQELRDDIPPTGAGNDRYEQTLSDLGFFDGPSENFDIAEDGVVSTQAGSMCT